MKKLRIKISIAKRQVALPKKREQSRSTLTTSDGKAKPRYKYKLRFMPEAFDEWRSLDDSVQGNLKKLLAKRLDNPHVPGGQLHGPLSGCYKLKLRKQAVRLVYFVEDDHLLVTVVAVDKRKNGVVYESALARLSAAASALNAGPLPGCVAP